MVKALIMAGGEGKRIKTDVEKPLIKIKEKPMISYVIDALRGANRVEEIMVATSKHCPETQAFLEELRIKTIKTPGEGYIDDLGFVISKIRSDDVLLTVTADLPLLNSKIIDHVISEYEKCGKPAMCVMVPTEIFEEYGLKPSMVFEDLVPSGLNILRSINKQQDEEVFCIEKIELALNINSCEDIIFLEKVLGDRNG